MCDVLKRLEISPNESVDSKTGLSRDDINIKGVSSSFIRMSVQGSSRQEVAKFTSIAIEELKDIHMRMTKLNVDLWQEELNQINLELIATHNESERLRGWLSLPLSSISERDFYKAILASNTLTGLIMESRMLRERKYTLQEQLNPTVTYPTSFSQIEAPEQPVSPKKSHFAAGGFVIGLLIALLLSLLRSRISADKRR